jgi:hypothetical protein
VRRPSRPEKEDNVTGLGDHDRYLYNLLIDPSWIERRVETFELLDHLRVRRSVSIDINVNTLRRFAVDYGLTVENRLAAPLGILHKQLLIEFSVEDAGGRPLSLLTNDYGGDSVLERVLLHLVDREGGFQPRLGNNYQNFVEAIESDIFHITHPIDARKLLNSQLDDRAEASTMMEVDSVLMKAILSRLDDRPWLLDDSLPRREDVWRQLFSIRRFVDILKYAIDRFVQLVAVPVDTDRIIIKFDHIETGHWPLNQENSVGLISNARPGGRIPDRPRSHGVATRLRLAFRSLGQFVGITPTRVSLDLSSMSRCPREHRIFSCPNGVCATGMKYLPESVQEDPSNDTTVMRQVKREETLLYVRSSRAAYTARLSPVVDLYLRPRLTGFYTAALTALIVSTLLSSMSFLFTDSIIKCGKLTDSVSSITTLFLVSSSLFSLYAARPAEHSYRGRMLRLPRFLVGFSGTAPTLVVGTAIFASETNAVYVAARIAFVVCVINFLYFLAFSSICYKARGGVIRRSGEVCVIASKRQ